MPECRGDERIILLEKYYQERPREEVDNIPPQGQLDTFFQEHTIAEADAHYDFHSKRNFEIGLYTMTAYVIGEYFEISQLSILNGMILTLVIENYISDYFRLSPDASIKTLNTLVFAEAVYFESQMLFVISTFMSACLFFDILASVNDEQALESSPGLTL